SRPGYPAEYAAADSWWEGDMNRLLSPGVATLALTCAAGIWITVSPFVMNSQAAGVWSPVAVNNVVAGTILIIVSLLGIGAHMVLALHALAQDPPERVAP
ncbi:MAG TPA: hypothetical protein VHB98_00760, partial [Chloroflexota bacterium]|nr:hypothetical protein [Chloroflexota bacterium]